MLSLSIKSLNKIKKFDYDFIFASRYQGKGGSEDDNLVTFVGNKIFTWFGNFFLNLKISDILYTFILGKTLVKNSSGLSALSHAVSIAFATVDASTTTDFIVRCPYKSLIIIQYYNSKSLLS